jgi:cation-transporting ATPase 13A1
MFSTPDGGCTCFVLRTGFGTTQGELMRTILFATERVTVGDSETLWFILGLLVFAVAASAYVLNAGLEDAAASRWKLFLHCTMIITSVVPPELPMELSLAVTNSLNALRQQMIYCVEPFRIPFAGKVDVCCFDKTGTLTSDQFRFVGVALAPKIDAPGGEAGNSAETSREMVSDSASLHRHTVHVLAACNSLIWLNGSMAGDPMEAATVDAVRWVVRSDRAAPLEAPPLSFFGGDASPKIKPAMVGLTVVRRLGFSSALKRMSVVVRVAHEEGALYVLTKGAPETIAKLLAADAVDRPMYTQAQKRYTSTGKRVLALAYRRLDTIGVTTASQVSKMARGELESNLSFAGLLVLDSPLKPQSRPAVHQLLRSAHRVVVITGDNALTACSVSSQLRVMKRKQELQLVLKPAADRTCVAWFPVVPPSASSGTVPFDSGARAIYELGQRYDLCVTGSALSWLARNQSHGGTLSSPSSLAPPMGTATAAHGDKGSHPAEYVEPEVPLSIMQSLACNVLVFARTAPVQKERVLTALNSLGLTTLMCGDGTNDVGALKQAHVGISIINDVAMDKMAEEKSLVQEKLLKGKKNRSKGSGKQQELYQMLRQMEMEQDQQSRMVQLGDASVASPFTSKTASIACALDVIRQGRCTLVTTLQMYKILAVNCLLGAYSLSVLYLYGVKQGDTQMTFFGLAVAAFFFFVSRSKPLPMLAEQRPPSRVFSPFVLLSVSCQFFVHFLTLSCAMWLCDEHVDPSDPSMMQDGDFRPNVINTVVFLVSIIFQVNSFGANYRGEPFMESLRDNKGLHRSLLAGWAVGFVCASDVLMPLNDMFQLVPLPSSSFRFQIVGLLVLDTIATFGFEWLIRKWYGSETPKIPAVLASMLKSQNIS